MLSTVALETCEAQSPIKLPAPKTLAFKSILVEFFLALRAWAKQPSRFEVRDGQFISGGDIRSRPYDNASVIPDGTTAIWDAGVREARAIIVQMYFLVVVATAESIEGANKNCFPKHQGLRRGKVATHILGSTVCCFQYEIGAYLVCSTNLRSNI